MELLLELPKPTYKRKVNCWWSAKWCSHFGNSLAALQKVKQKSYHML
jgi:hypothetical protein